MNRFFGGSCELLVVNLLKKETIGRAEAACVTQIFAQLGTFRVQCNELCGLWHAAMYNYGHVLTPTAFQAWASALQFKEANNGILSALPPYATTYDPTVIPQIGQEMLKVDGITGAPGYYYPARDPVTP